MLVGRKNVPSLLYASSLLALPFLLVVFYLIVAAWMVAKASFHLVTIRGNLLKGMGGWPTSLDYFGCHLRSSSWSFICYHLIHGSKFDSVQRQLHLQRLATFDLVSDSDKLRKFRGIRA
jgi:hypothetical protein